MARDRGGRRDGADDKQATARSLRRTSSSLAGRVTGAAAGDGGCHRGREAPPRARSVHGRVRTSCRLGAAPAQVTPACRSRLAIAAPRCVRIAATAAGTRGSSRCWRAPLAGLSRVHSFHALTADRLPRASDPSMPVWAATCGGVERDRTQRLQTLARASLAAPHPRSRRRRSGRLDVAAWAHSWAADRFAPWACRRDRDVRVRLARDHIASWRWSASTWRVRQLCPCMRTSGGGSHRARS